jgi:hypothetical protein
MAKEVDNTNESEGPLALRNGTTEQSEEALRHRQRAPGQNYGAQSRSLKCGKR